MARYTGPVCRLCRREGMKLFLKGEKCLTKCTFERRSSPPGMHQQRRRKVSDFALQLREKQKLRRIYGVLERQMRNTFEQAAEVKGATGEVMLQNLERRLDNTVYRAGFAKSRSQARQLVSHGHIKVNDRMTKTPSYQVKAGRRHLRARVEPRLELLQGDAGLGEDADASGLARDRPRQLQREGARGAGARSDRGSGQHAAHR